MEIGNNLFLFRAHIPPMTTLKKDLTTESIELISGIQQVGIGVTSAAKAWSWYGHTLGLSVPVFDDIAHAKLMTPHTGGVIRERRAILAVNLAGGGGAEIWESRSPVPIPASVPSKLGDLGIFALKVKCRSVAQWAKNHGKLSTTTPAGTEATWMQDPEGNHIQITNDSSWFRAQGSGLTGGILGVMIGVSDIDRALVLYQDTLGIQEMVYDVSGLFDDFASLPEGNKTYRRVLLRKKQSSVGAFSELYGNIEIELVQALDRTPVRIFDGRSWGDLGYIHLCFDALNMEKIRERCTQNGFPFTVDSATTFDMGEAGGRFSYIQDPDGTLIEFVETHKVPIMKKWGWFLDLTKRKHQKPLPKWMIAAMGWGKVKPLKSEIY